MRHAGLRFATRVPRLPRRGTVLDISDIRITLRDANKLKGDNIMIGQKLVIPGASGTAAPAPEAITAPP